MPHTLPLRRPGRRRAVLAAVAVWAAVAALPGCGFALRTRVAMPFATIAVNGTGGNGGKGVAADLVRFYGDAVRPAVPAPGEAPPEVIVDILKDQRDKVAVGVNASGQVVEYELRLTVVFKARTPQGRVLIPPTTLELSRGISFNETIVLSKDAEELFLYRDMQTDVVQQLSRRLAIVKLSAAPVAPASSTRPPD